MPLLKWKLLQSFVPLAVIMMSLIGVIVWVALEDSHQQQSDLLQSWIFEDIEKQAKTNHAFINQIYLNQDYLVDIATSKFNSQPLLHDLLEKSQADTVTYYLRQFTQNHRIDLAVILDTDNNLLATSSDNIKESAFRQQLLSGSLGKYLLDKQADGDFSNRGYGTEIFHGIVDYESVFSDYRQIFHQLPYPKLYGYISITRIENDFGDPLGTIVASQFIRSFEPEFLRINYLTQSSFISFIDGKPDIILGFDPPTSNLSEQQIDEILEGGRSSLFFESGGQKNYLHCLPFNSYEEQLISIQCTGFPLAPAMARSETILSALHESKLFLIITLVTVTIISTILFILISFFLSNRITTPIKLVTESLVRLSKNDTDAEVPINVDTLELQQLADTMSTFRDNVIQRLAAEQLLQDSNVELEQAKIKAESSEQAKSEFLSTMSHELRTPLNAVISISQMLSVELNDKPENARYLRLIEKSGLQLLKLVEELLDVAATTDGRLIINESKIEINSLIELALVQTRAEALKKSISLNYDADTGVHKVWGDADRLLQVFRNILDNAIKFIEAEGDITVSTSIDNDGSLSIRFTDTGIGMDSTTVEDAFSLLKQGDSSMTRAYGGMGLGLYLSKALIELHSGSISIESEPNVGTTVTVSLPTARIIKG